MNISSSAAHQPTASIENSEEADDGNDNPLAGVLNNNDSMEQMSDDNKGGGGVKGAHEIHDQGGDITATEEMGTDYPHVVKKPAMSNIIICVKNTDNLEEFSLRTYMEPEYIPKLQKWIEKNKYRCEETIDDVKLQVQIFNFSL